MSTSPPNPPGSTSSLNNGPSHHWSWPIIPAGVQANSMASSERDSWLTLPATFEHVFWTGEKELWQAVVNEVQYQEADAPGRDSRGTARTQGLN